MTTFQISQLAARTGVPTSTLRFYEKAGLLTADRTSGGYRIFDEEAVERLGFIGAAKLLGLPLEEIAQLLGVWETGACTDVRAELRPRVAARVVEAESRIVELEVFASSLRSALEHLDALPDRAGRCDPKCGFLGASGRRTPVMVDLAPRRREETEAERWRTVPVSCSLTGDDQQARTDRWQEALAGAVREPIPDGMRLVLPVDRTAVVAELAGREQQCCPFFDFRLHVDGPVVRMEVRAPADGAGLLAELFGPAA
ncbi:MerR family transcriptional regulator [Streptomyces sp. NBC_01511]|uniref:MerR family transcriptional regulator n=1 Tax=Streptomyces sp. NBC_01511 TaxID=2903889 RepID=UPI0038706DA6